MMLIINALNQFSYLAHCWLSSDSEFKVTGANSTKLLNF